MQIKNEDDIIQLVQKDNWMMEVLKVVKTLDLRDWWVCAGFVRSKIWDVLHNYEHRTPTADVDVVYFDPIFTEEKIEKELEERLKKLKPDIPWSVKNEARMHEVNNINPYKSAVDAIAKFPETVTALGIKLSDSNEVILTAPHGIQDVINLEVKPTPSFKASKELMAIFEERLLKKNWHANWPKVKICNEASNFKKRVR